MSPLVTRPSLPEPGTVDAPMPVSAESLRTDGASGASAGGVFGAGAGAAAPGGGGAGGGGDVAERTGRGRRDLDRDLVGLEFNQRLIDRDGIAGLLEPAADGGLGHGFAECRNANFSHDLYPQ